MIQATFDNTDETEFTLTDVKNAYGAFKLVGGDEDTYYLPLDDRSIIQMEYIDEETTNVRVCNESEYTHRKFRRSRKEVTLVFKHDEINPE